ncbi:MAG: hypothetical protein PUJ46_04605 [Alistipes sp.]|nr:hypothetical protein [Alistipes sp.]
MPTYSEIVYNFTFDETANRTTDETTDRTADRTADETTDRTADETTDRTADRTTDRTADRTTDETADETADRTTDHSSISFVPIIRVNPDFQRNRLICKFASLLKILFIRKFNKDVRNHNRQTGILL